MISHLITSLTRNQFSNLYIEVHFPILNTIRRYKLGESLRRLKGQFYLLNFQGSLPKSEEMIDFGKKKSNNNSF